MPNVDPVEAVPTSDRVPCRSAQSTAGAVASAIPLPMTTMSMKVNAARFGRLGFRLGGFLGHSSVVPLDWCEHRRGDINAPWVSWTAPKGCFACASRSGLTSLAARSLTSQQQPDAVRALQIFFSPSSTGSNLLGSSFTVQSCCNRLSIGCEAVAVVNGEQQRPVLVVGGGVRGSAEG